LKNIFFILLEKKKKKNPNTPFFYFWKKFAGNGTYGKIFFQTILGAFGAN